jgi:glycosyltransferase involved in cell wall biosynthesis
VIVKADAAELDLKTVAIDTVKVLHLINGEHFSGAERVQDLLASALPDFGYEVGFVCLKPKKFPEVRTSETPLFNLNMNSKFDFRCYKRVVQMVREHGYQVLHAHTPRTLMIGSMAAKRLGCPLVYHVHSPVGRDSNRGLMNRLNTTMEKYSLKRVDRMVCVSNSLQGYMEELGHPSEKLRVVSNGVAPMESAQPRTASKGVWTIGTMALFRPRKGTEVLLDALKILKDKGTEVKLRAVGPFETPEYEAEILKQVERLGIGDMIEWTGFQTDVNQQLDLMDLFVLPSLYGEGLPMVVLEAMANAVPVVAANVEGIPEAVRDGVDGLIFEPANPQDLADKLTSIIGDDERLTQMSRSALRRQREKLSDAAMAEGVAKVYDELL